MINQSLKAELKTKRKSKSKTKSYSLANAGLKSNLAFDEIANSKMLLKNFVFKSHNFMTQFHVGSSDLFPITAKLLFF